MLLEKKFIHALDLQVSCEQSEYIHTDQKKFETIVGRKKKTLIAADRGESLAGSTKIASGVISLGDAETVRPSQSTTGDGSL